MIRGLASAIGLLVALAPVPVRAQTNIDQGKSAAQIFAAGCAECHKAAHGLANGKNNAALTDFLREHYTTSREQAAALAAYVLGGRGSEPIGAPLAQRRKPPAEESKPAKHQAQRPAKPDEGAAADAKPQRSMDATTGEPKEEGAASEPPSSLRAIMQPESGEHENGPTAAARSRREEPNSAQHPKPSTPVAPASAVAEPTPPSPSTTSSRHMAPMAPTVPTAAVPAAATSSEPSDAPVPRDNIPD